MSMYEPKPKRYRLSGAERKRPLSSTKKYRQSIGVSWPEMVKVQLKRRRGIGMSLSRSIMQTIIFLMVLCTVIHVINAIPG